MSDYNIWDWDWDWDYLCHEDLDDNDYEDDGKYANQIQEFDLDDEYKLFREEDLFPTFPIPYVSYDSVAYIMLRNTNDPTTQMISYSQLLQLATQCQGLLKAWQTRLVEQGASEERTSLITFDKSTVGLGSTWGCLTYS